MSFCFLILVLVILIKDSSGLKREVSLSSLERNSGNLLPEYDNAFESIVRKLHKLVHLTIQNENPREFIAKELYQALKYSKLFVVLTRFSDQYLIPIFHNKFFHPLQSTSDTELNYLAEEKKKKKPSVIEYDKILNDYHHPKHRFHILKVPGLIFRKSKSSLSNNVRHDEKSQQQLRKSISLPAEIIGR